MELVTFKVNVHESMSQSAHLLGDLVRCRQHISFLVCDFVSSEKVLQAVLF